MTGRGRLWRWAVAVWVILVAVAGGLTLWLRDAAEPPGPYVWERAGPARPVPSPPEGVGVGVHDAHAGRSRAGTEALHLQLAPGPGSPPVSGSRPVRQ